MTRQQRKAIEINNNISNEELIKTIVNSLEKNFGRGSAMRLR